MTEHLSEKAAVAVANAASHWLSVGPDMLEALKEAHEFIDGMAKQIVTPRDNKVSRLAKKLAQAIALAEGRRP